MQYKMNYDHVGSFMCLTCTLYGGGEWVSTGMGEHYEPYSKDFRYYKGRFEYRDDSVTHEWMEIPDMRDMTEEDLFQLSTVMKLPYDADFLIKLQKKFKELSWDYCPNIITV